MCCNKKISPGCREKKAIAETRIVSNPSSTAVVAKTSSKGMSDNGNVSMSCTSKKLVSPDTAIATRSYVMNKDRSMKKKELNTNIQPIEIELRDSGKQSYIVCNTGTYEYFRDAPLDFQGGRKFG